MASMILFNVTLERGMSKYSYQMRDKLGEMGGKLKL